jgi:parallel beta-helix repeat protein
MRYIFRKLQFSKATQKPVRSPMIAVLAFVAFSALGLLNALAQATLVVSQTGIDCQGNQPAYTSIQVAVNAALPGSTISVCPGTYAEQVVVTKNNLTIRGSEGEGASGQHPGLTVLRPSLLPVDPGSPITGAPRKAILLVNGATGVAIANLTIDGSAVDAGTAKLPSCFRPGFTLGIYYRNSAGTVASTHTTNIRSAVRCSVGIFIESGGGGAAKVTVNGNIVDNYGTDGLVCNGAGTACTVIGNTLRGRGPVDDVQSGIVIRAGAVGRVRLNSVRGHLCTDPSCGPDLVNQGQAPGIIVEPDPSGTIFSSGTIISENSVADNDVGIYQYGSPDCCSIGENHLTNNRFFGIVIQNGNGTTSENEIRGGQIGIGVAADAANTVGVLRGDEIRGTTVAPVREFACCGFKATAIVTKDGAAIATAASGTMSIIEK